MPKVNTVKSNQRQDRSQMEFDSKERIVFNKAFAGSTMIGIL